MTLERVRVTGSGAAAALVLACFDRAGFAVDAKGSETDGPARQVVLNGATLSLIEDLLGSDTLAALHAAGRVLSHRVVMWGELVEQVPQSALLIDTSRLAKVVAPVQCSAPGNAPLALMARGRKFNSGAAAGPRFAYVWPELDIVLPDPNAFYIVAVPPLGWAFLASPEADRCILQTLAAQDDPALAEQVGLGALRRLGLQADLNGWRMFGGSDAAPRFGAPLVPDGFSLGDECLRLDPLCGDGIGHALRAGVLLAALLGPQGADASKRARIYTARMRHCFVAHLHACETHYRLFEADPAWSTLQWEMRRARLLHEALLAEAAPPPYVLNRTTARPDQPLNITLEIR